ncbi:MAG: hypothetical protein R6U39_09575 [Candidatus Aegiribacteria sp.]
MRTAYIIVLPVLMSVIPAIAGQLVLLSGAGASDYQVDSKALLWMRAVCAWVPCRGSA